MDKRIKAVLKQNLNSDIRTRIAIVLYQWSKTSSEICSSKESVNKVKKEIIPNIVKYIDEVMGTIPTKRRVGRWYLCETLGKGGYSWVKKGVDEKNGRMVALKFISRKHKNWTQTQIKQVRTEIEVLKSIKHPNIMKLLAYNLKCQYPNENDNTSAEVILLVLEYMAGGELFDYLYYTGRFNEIIARTYFNQLINAVYVCHSHGVIHRDIKPQNLLLNHKFQLKLTDFGLSKLVLNESDKIMKTHVGTGGYQAPEILETKKYTKSVDTFSCGVVLFIFIAGHPPFNDANNIDKWYKYIYNKELKKFWKTHKNSQKYFNRTLIDLVTRMLIKDPQERIKLSKIHKHRWMKETTVLDKDSLYKYFKIKHQQMRIKRQNDPIKQGMLKGDTHYDPSKQLAVRGEFEDAKLKPIGYNLKTKPQPIYDTVLSYDDVSVDKKGSKKASTHTGDKPADVGDDKKEGSNNDGLISEIKDYDDIKITNVHQLNVYDIYLKEKYNNEPTWDILECIEHCINHESIGGVVLYRNYQMFQIICQVKVQTDVAKDDLKVRISFRMFYNDELNCLYLQIKNVTRNTSDVSHKLMTELFHHVMGNKILAKYLFKTLKDVEKSEIKLTKEDELLLAKFDPLSVDEKPNKKSNKKDKTKAGDDAGDDDDDLDDVVDYTTE